jgi:small subunit ribosomal protein S7
MARRRRAEKRKLTPDPRYGSVQVAQFINKVMVNGKKSVAQRIVYQALEQASDEVRRQPLEVLDQVVRNATPMLEVKARRVGGATYQVPIEVRPDRRVSLAMRWLVRYARARAGMPMRERLKQEFLEAYRGQGAAVKRKEDLHRMAEANRAFAHYRW